MFDGSLRVVGLGECASNGGCDGPIDQCGKVGEGVARGRWVGGVRIYEYNRAQTFDEIVFELRRDVDGKLNRSLTQGFLSCSFRCIGHRDGVVGTGLKGGDDCAGYRSMISVYDRSWEVFGVAVNRKPE